MSTAGQGPIGVILAGGRGSRLGGAKALVQLGGRPLIAWPLAALRSALEVASAESCRVVVVAKAGTPLPPLGGVPVWSEPAEPHHPLAGLVEALERAGGRAVLVCALDLPFVSPETLARLARADGDCVVAAAAGRPQPLLGRYGADALALLRRALAAEPLPAMRDVAALLGAEFVEVPLAELVNINTAADLARAQARLDESYRRGPRTSERPGRAGEIR